MLDKLKPYWPWAFRALVLLGILFLAYSWNSARKAREELSRELERERLEKADLLAARDAAKGDLRRAEQSILDHDAAFRLEKERLEKLLGDKPQVVEVIKWKTKSVPLPVYGPELPLRECPQPGPDGKQAPKIVLVEGDAGHVEGSEVTYETREKNQVVIITAVCMRDTPTPLKLFSSPVEADVSSLLKREDMKQVRWGAGGFFAFTKDGWAAGPKLLFPPVRIFGLSLEADAGVGLGTNGVYVGELGAGVRW